jgi:hypothetical protein
MTAAVNGYPAQQPCLIQAGLRNVERSLLDVTGEYLASSPDQVCEQFSIMTIATSGIYDKITRTQMLAQGLVCLLSYPDHVELRV